MTFGDALSTARNKQDIPRGEVFLKLLKDLRTKSDIGKLIKQKITGRIVMGWDDLDLKCPLIQDVLEETMKMKNWTPLEYLINFYIASHDMYPESIHYDLGRALRNLPSYLREYYIATQLESKGLKCTVPSADLNASHHVDIIIHEAEDIYVWSYLNTPKSIDYLRKKLEYRGKIHKGLNLLLPIKLNSETVSYFDWLMPTDEYADEIMNALDFGEMEYKEVLTSNTFLKRKLLFRYD